MKYPTSMSNKKGASVICEICSKASSKYKCPSCRLRYCSVGCFKLHKGDQSCENLTQQREDEKKKLELDTQLTEGRKDGKPEGESGDESDSEDRVKPEVLENLEHSTSLRAMLQNKHLQKMIKNIDSSPDPEKILHESMQVPIFTEFVDVCLGIVEPEEHMESR